MKRLLLATILCLLPAYALASYSPPNNLRYASNISSNMGTAISTATLQGYENLVIDQDMTLTADVSVPYTMTISMVAGAEIDGGYTLTVNGPFIGSKGCFGATLAPVFGRNSVTEVLLSWYGATQDGSADDSDALEMAKDSMFEGCTLVLDGNSLFNTGVEFTNQIILDFGGNDITYTGAGIFIHMSTGGSITDHPSRIENGTLTSDTIGNGTAIQIDQSSGIQLERLRILSFNKGVELTTAVDGGRCESTMFLGVTMRGCNYGLYLDGSGYATTIISYGQTRFLGLNISTNGADAAVPYGVYQEANTSLYRSYFAPLTIWSESDGTICFYTDGSWNGIYGELGFEHQATGTNDTALKTGANAALLNGDLNFNITGTFNTFIDHGAAGTLTGIKTGNVNRARKSGVLSSIYKIYDTDLTTGRVFHDLDLGDNPRFRSDDVFKFENIADTNLAAVEISPQTRNAAATGTETTYDVSNATVLKFSQSGATDFTSFTSPISNGHILTVVFLNGNTTLKDATGAAPTINMKDDTDYTGAANINIQFRYDLTDNKWYEIGR